MTRFRSSGPPSVFAEGWKSIPTPVLTELPHYFSFPSFKKGSELFFRCVGFQSFSGRLLEVLSQLFSERGKAQVTTNTGTVWGEKAIFLVFSHLVYFELQDRKSAKPAVTTFHGSLGRVSSPQMTPVVFMEHHLLHLSSLWMCQGREFTPKEAPRFW